MEGKLQRADGNGAEAPVAARHPERAPGGPALARLVIDETEYTTQLTRKFRQRRPWQPTDPHAVAAAIPGLILAVAVREGERVRSGQPLLVLEAMKMQNQIVSPLDGAVAAIHVQVGQKVVKGEVMIELRD